MNFKIEIKKELSNQIFKGTWGELWGSLANLGFFEGTFTFGYFDRGNQGGRTWGNQSGRFTAPCH